MTDDVAHLMLEHLKYIRGSVDAMAADISDLKLRVSAVEEHLASHQTQFSALNRRMDRFDERLARIERRLDLVEV